jgi:exodeoxyribonuclease VII small subunit
MSVEKMSFEEAFNRLNATAAELEKGNLTLEQSLALYEEGVLLAQRCKELLGAAELRITQLAPGGKPSTSEIDLDEEDDFI